ncbi:hypothetical protein WN72_10460 [Bradyrhizobium arachidis]|uniref:Uncharacterized protein n=1 Tax=Bradyrhizobium arachidis TaxID=858423 RepID=A0AAE7NLY7_9BRAD|nr:hypothetical protein WN72_10460 [Bradyrhizobium arachidis]
MGHLYMTDGKVPGDRSFRMQTSCFDGLLAESASQADSCAILYWVPTLDRRITADTDLQIECGRTARQANATPSDHGDLLLGTASGGNDDCRRQAAEEVRRLEESWNRSWASTQ